VSKKTGAALNWRDPNKSIGELGWCYRTRNKNGTAWLSGGVVIYVGNGDLSDKASYSLNAYIRYHRPPTSVSKLPGVKVKGWRPLEAW
jgi:hypothetical protein